MKPTTAEILSAIGALGLSSQQTDETLAEPDALERRAAAAELLQQGGYRILSTKRTRPSTRKLPCVVYSGPDVLRLPRPQALRDRDERQPPAWAKYRTGEPDWLIRREGALGSFYNVRGAEAPVTEWLRRDGLTGAEVRMILGPGRPSAERRRKQQIVAFKFAEMRAHGATFTGIADAVGVNRDTVADRAHEAIRRLWVSLLHAQALIAIGRPDLAVVKTPALSCPEG